MSDYTYIPVANEIQYREVDKELTEIYKAKNADYGDSFNKSMDKYGFIAYLVRANDKLERLEQLHQNAAQVKDETILDTLMDLCNYSKMAIMWLKRGRGNAQATRK